MKKYKLKDKIVFEIINEWRHLDVKNWISFTFLYVYFEKENMTHGYEFWFVVLGLGFYVRYNTDKAMRQFDKWEKETRDYTYKFVKVKKNG